MWLYLLSLWMKPQCVTIQMKANLTIILQNEIQYVSLSFELSTFESVK